MPRTILPDPPGELKQLSRTLSDLIRDEIRASGMIPFSRFMERALYEPGLGYYSAGLHKLGAGGDFVTAPELGSLFATCLANQVRQLGEALGDFEILEIGAGTGRLAADLLAALGEDCLPRSYRILERSADLRQVQRDHLAACSPELLDRVQWIDQPPDESWQGVLIANEVLDALVVERFELSGGKVRQLCVSDRDGRFCWRTRAAPEALDSAVRTALAMVGRSPEALGSGYRSEINLELTPWLRAATAGLQRGLGLFIDYGYPRGDYYAVERRDGTLMCHYRHRAHDDVFFWPGLQDLTAWVDFTALAEAADACGLAVEGFTSQAMFLLGCGLDAVLAGRVQASADGGLAATTEARQLTLPGVMGERFRVMGLGRGLDLPLAGFSLQDLSYRL
jgi:SAM-dependent MidA family methyltransferase